MSASAAPAFSDDGALRPSSPAATLDALDAGVRVQLGRAERAVLIALCADEPEAREQAVHWLAGLPFLYRDRAVTQFREAALLLALQEAVHPSDTFPRLPSGEQLMVAENEGGIPTLIIPLYVRGVQPSKPWAYAAPPELRGHDWTVPWTWPWPYFMRGYLPWAFRRWVEFLRDTGLPDDLDVAFSLDEDVLGSEADDPVSRHEMVADDSVADPSAQVLSRWILSQLSDDDREWYRLLFEVGVASDGVPGYSANAVRKRKERLRQRLESIVKEAYQPGGVGWAFQALLGSRDAITGTPARAPRAGGFRRPPQALRGASVSRPAPGRYSRMKQPRTSWNGKRKGWTEEWGKENEPLSSEDYKSIRRDVQDIPRGHVLYHHESPTLGAYEDAGKQDRYGPSLCRECGNKVTRGGYDDGFCSDECFATRRKRAEMEELVQALEEAQGAADAVHGHVTAALAKAKQLARRYPDDAEVSAFVERFLAEVAVTQS